MNRFLVSVLFFGCVAFTSCSSLTNVKEATGEADKLQRQEALSTYEHTTSGMALIPAGEFVMGRNGGHRMHHGGGGHEHHHNHHHKDADFGTHEHKVYLDAYYIDKHEVTNGNYAKFIDAGGYDIAELWTDEGWKWRQENDIKWPMWWTEDETANYKGSPNYPDHPVTGISWHEATAYARWIGKRLPSEAQWEKAARGSNTDYVYPWGDAEPDCALANFCADKHKFCVGSTAAVGSIENGKSPYGVYDMAGNVWEWCRDVYMPDYYMVSPYKNPECTDGGVQRVLRGGSWLNAKEFITSTFRRKTDQELRNYFNGFRCVMAVKD